MLMNRIVIPLKTHNFCALLKVKDKLIFPYKFKIIFLIYFSNLFF